VCDFIVKAKRVDNQVDPAYLVATTRSGSPFARCTHVRINPHNLLHAPAAGFDYASLNDQRGFLTFSSPALIYEYILTDRFMYT
jgi:hypothetical protein